MKLRRIVTAESKSGVVVQASDLSETTSAGLPTNIWGFDQLPTPTSRSRTGAWRVPAKGPLWPERRPPS